MKATTPSRNRNPNKAALEALGEGTEPAHGAPVPLTIEPARGPGHPVEERLVGLDDVDVLGRQLGHGQGPANRADLP